MKRNLSLPDSFLRIGLAIALMLAVVTNKAEGVWGSLAIVFGLFFGVTALVRYCPFYAFFGIGSRPKSGEGH